MVKKSRSRTDRSKLQMGAHVRVRPTESLIAGMTAALPSPAAAPASAVSVQAMQAMFKNMQPTEGEGVLD